jgi:hypothetical protein
MLPRLLRNLASEKGVTKTKDSDRKDSYVLEIKRVLVSMEPFLTILVSTLYSVFSLIDY